MRYKHADLMDELNELFIAVKVHLYSIELKRPIPKPAVEEIDRIHTRINHILMMDAEPMIRK